MPESKQREEELRKNIVHIATCGQDSEAEKSLVQFIHDVFYYRGTGYWNDEAVISCGMLNVNIKQIEMGGFLAKTSDDTETKTEQLIQKLDVPNDDLYDDLKASIKRIFKNFAQNYKEQVREISTYPSLVKTFNQNSSVSVGKLLR